MAQFGSIVYRGNKALLTPDGQGGVFQQVVTFGTNAQSHTFTDADTMELFWVCIYGGYHNIQYGRDGNGYPYLYADGFAIPEGGSTDPVNWQTRLAVFSR
jgi:hypothetical protein